MILETIIKYGLSIRQIPLSITKRYAYNGKELAENQSLETWKPDLAYFESSKSKYNIDPADKQMKSFYNRFPEGRTFVVETKIPKNAGYWMCKRVVNTDSLVKWDIRTDNLAPTLEESINLFLKN